MSIKPALKIEGSLMLGAALVTMVFANYQLTVGNVSVTAATDANHPVLEASRKKAGFTSLIMVAGLALLARDPNMVILGGGAIIAMEINYRTGIMAHPDTGKITPPAASAYQPAQNVVPIGLQAEPG